MRNWRVNSDIEKIGIGARESFGVEYLLSERIGIGLELSYIITRYPGADKHGLPDDVDYGIDHLGLMLGIRIYSPFK